MFAAVIQRGRPPSAWLSPQDATVDEMPDVINHGAQNGRIIVQPFILQLFVCAVEGLSR